MDRLTSAQFIDEMQKAPEWQLIQGPHSGQLLLAVRRHPKDKDVKYFLGPHPEDMENGEYLMFKAAVEDVISMKATHDDQSTTDAGESDVSTEPA